MPDIFLELWDTFVIKTKSLTLEEAYILIMYIDILIEF